MRKFVVVSTTFGGHTVSAETPHEAVEKVWGEPHPKNLTQVLENAWVTQCSNHAGHIDYVVVELK